MPQALHGDVGINILLVKARDKEHLDKVLPESLVECARETAELERFCLLLHGYLYIRIGNGLVLDVEIIKQIPQPPAYKVAHAKRQPPKERPKGFKGYIRCVIGE